MDRIIIDWIRLTLKCYQHVGPAKQLAEHFTMLLLPPNLVDSSYNVLARMQVLGSSVPHLKFVADIGRVN